MESEEACRGGLRRSNTVTLRQSSHQTQARQSTERVCRAVTLEEEADAAAKVQKDATAESRNSFLYAYN